MRVKDPETQPAEVLAAAAIVSISEGIKRLQSTRLSERTLHMLIADAAPPVGNTHPRKYVSPKEVRAVLQGIADLEKVHLKKAR